MVPKFLGGGFPRIRTGNPHSATFCLGKEAVDWVQKCLVVFCQGMTNKRALDGAFHQKDLGITNSEVSWPRISLNTNRLHTVPPESLSSPLPLSTILSTLLVTRLQMAGRSSSRIFASTCA